MEPSPSATTLPLENGDSVKGPVEDLKQDISSSKNWRLLVYGSNEYHLSILSGILGEQCPNTMQGKYSYKKNGVSVEVLFRPESIISHEYIDLFIYFIPIEEDRIQDEILRKMPEEIEKITRNHGEMIWKHSVVVFSGMEATAENYKKKDNVCAQFETFLENCMNTVQSRIRPALNNYIGVAANEVLIRPAGSLKAPDLPTPHEKWFSLLWHGCFLSSKVNSLPAILKISQDRLKYDVKTKEIRDVPFHEQPISTNHGLLGKIKLAFGRARATSAIARVSESGERVGALVSALACGVSSSGVAAGTGLLLGGPPGEDFGDSMAVTDLAGKNDSKNDSNPEVNKKLGYAQMVTKFPKVSRELKTWASKRTTSKLVVTGMYREGVSTAATALTGVRATNNVFKLPASTEARDNVEVYDCEGFQEDLKTMSQKAKKVINFQSEKDLLVFCVPMTATRQEFVHSFHIKVLERLHTEDANIFSKTVIALTHANELQLRHNNQSEITFKEFFNEELDQWKKEIKLLLEKNLRLSSEAAGRVKVIVIGSSDQPTIKLSESEEYHWQSKFYLEILSQTQSPGLPILIKMNRKRIGDQGDDYFDKDHAKQVLIDTQCAMFSGKGKEQFEKFSGETIGLIMGVNETQDW